MSPVPDGFPDAAVGMAAQDQIKVGHRLGQQLVLGLFGVVPCAAVGNADDHVRIFVRLDLCHGGFTACIGSLNFSSQVGAQESASLPKTPTTAMRTSPFCTTV